MLTLHTLPKSHGRKKIRYGRGNSSKGNYSGRGIKGQRARSGGRAGLKLRGLKQSIMAMPKIGGFRSLKIPAQVVNLSHLEKHFEAGSVVTPVELFAKGVISTIEKPVKVLSNGSLTKAITVQLHAASYNAMEAIKKAGGTFEALKIPGAKKKKKPTKKTAKRIARRAQ